MLKLEFEYCCIPIPHSDITGFQCYASVPEKLVFFTAEEVLFYTLKEDRLVETQRLKHKKALKIVYPEQGDAFFLIQQNNSKIFKYDKDSLRCLEKLKTHKSTPIIDIDISEDGQYLATGDRSRNVYIISIETGLTLFHDKIYGQRPIRPLRSVNFLHGQGGLSVITETNGAQTYFFEARVSQHEPFLDNSTSMMGGEGMWQNIYHSNHPESSHLYIMEEMGHSKSWLYGPEFARHIRELAIPLKISNDGRYLVGKSTPNSALQITYIPSNGEGSLSVYEMPIEGGFLPSKQELAYWQSHIQFSPDDQTVYYLEQRGNGEWFLHVWLINP